MVLIQKTSNWEAERCGFGEGTQGETGREIEGGEMGKVLCVVGILLLAGCSGPQDNGEGTRPDVTGGKAVTGNPFGKTELHKAVTAGDMEKARVLLDKGANVNAKDKFGDTALHMAVSRGNIKLAELLLEKGADTNASDARGETPLHDAVTDGSTEMVKLLLDRGADVNAKDEDGKTPLDRAKTDAMRNHLNR
jgi:hypothetical protein